MKRRRSRPIDSPAAARDAVCACATARHVARLLTQLYDRFLRNAGVQAPQFALMVVLDKQAGCGPSAICRLCAMEKTTVSRNLRLLERRGWVVSSAASDRRQKRFELTPAGRKCLAAGWPEWHRAQDHLHAAMTAQEWTAMFRTFRTITQAAHAARGRLAAEEAKR